MDKIKKTVLIASLGTYLLFAAVAMFFVFVGFTKQNVRSVFKQEGKYLIDEDWYVKDVSVTMYSFTEKDFFADEQILSKAKQYTSSLGFAHHYEEEAEKYMTSLDPAYRYNPNKYDISKQDEAEAQDLMTSAYELRDELREMVKSTSIDPNNKEIWVIYSITYKNEYRQGPYCLSYLYKLSPRGKNVINREEFSYAADLFSDFYQATGKEYKETKIE